MIEEEIYLKQLLQEAIYQQLMVDIGVGLVVVSLLILSFVLIKNL
jgi:hypothetical protein